MPYVPGTITQGNSSLKEVKDIYKSSNVFVNFVPVALYNNEEGSEAAVLSQINSPFYNIDRATIELDGEENEGLVSTQQQRLIADRIITQNELNLARYVTPKRNDSNPGVNNSPLYSTGTVNTSTVSFLSSYPLTASTTLGDITQKPNVLFGYTVTASLGLSVGQIVENLQLLTLNCIEPIKAQYPNMFVTNSFRTAKNTSTTSQHPRGMSCDMQFGKVSKSEYYNIAIWIRDYISYDQLLLEYKTTGSGLPWIHISYNKDGNRNQVLTFMNDKKYAIGLADLSDIPI
jgi:hypothetical protein